MNIDNERGRLVSKAIEDYHQREQQPTEPLSWFVDRRLADKGLSKLKDGELQAANTWGRIFDG